MMGKIIAAGKEQIDELIKLAMEVYTGSTYEGLHQEFNEMFLTDKHRFLLYIMNDEPVAFMHLSIRVDYVQGCESSPTGYLEGVYVNPDFRKRGISTALFNEGKKWLLEKGCKQIGSDMEEGNQNSYLFHRSVGFKEAGRLVTFIQDLN
ncbi:aminoglycoside 6'-N-acetyltransferase [Paucisalibacillus globulus]|uniref:aminoglycoside 6'-N-acetyltransferase n=1 Tax=Paucisalibacillus globulus TaxID=351095 RepID=UPI0003FA638F|nr:aminoglycoside 6'-N-acetyltransferase [Paucisalibacillus globulus]